MADVLPLLNSYNVICKEIGVAELAPIRTTIYNQDISSGSSLDVSSKFFNVGFFICDFANSYYCIGLVLNNNNIFYLTPEAQIPTGVTISRNGTTGVFSIINNSGKDLRGIKLRLFSNNRG